MSNWFYFCIVVYCGGGKLVLENILALIDVGVKYGYKMIEFDVKLLKDGEIFLFYDDNFECISNGWGVVGELNWQDLLCVDVGSWYSKMFKGELLLLFLQVVECCCEYGMMVNIEIKFIIGIGLLMGKMVVLVVCELWVGMMLLLLLLFEIDVLEVV